ncbi:hypothetical protein XELAEV_18015471mg [Xenopus laevis]|uniref:Uncharacterized protein n=1 Tax=Xenopus laevis TaxID=8355 RepID=A0A974DKL4_XENLA|nr:hypothetical protein XELAEV_18015471mg [Xenopus laevis]
MHQYGLMFPNSLLENVSTKVINEMYNEEKSINQVYNPSSLCQFFCPVNSIFLKEGIVASLQINFIPFDLGKKFCTIIFSNKMVR